MTMRNHEALEQMAIIKWAQCQSIPRDYLIAIPNGGSRHPLEAKNLKRQGVKAGVSDLFLAYPMPPYAGLWIELKRPAPHKSIVSLAQAQWLERMRHIGYAGEIAYGSVDAIQKINHYLQGNNHECHE